MSELRIIKRLMLIVAIPLMFYLLKLLSFIFIPLIFALFVAVVFLPFMRWFERKKIPKAVAIVCVVIILVGSMKLGLELIQLSSKEILSSDTRFVEKAQDKLKDVIISFEDFFHFDEVGGKGIILKSIKEVDVSKTAFNYFGSTFELLRSIVVKFLMFLFFLVLLLAESVNVLQLMNKTMYKQYFSSVKIFNRIEKSLVTFIKVKFIISFFTGLGFSLACLFFDVSFPLFWGLFAFGINFVQMIGSVISVILLAIFAFVEIQSPGILLLFVLVITGVQVLFGSILEPVFMGKSFSINTITILVMLMFWGYLWGVAGLILSIPITVFLKTIFEQYTGTRLIADIMAGPEKTKLVQRVEERIQSSEEVL